MLEFNGNVSDCISINEVKKIPDVKVEKVVRAELELFFGSQPLP